MAFDSTVCAGIDVSKAKLDIAIDGEKTTFTVSNDVPGWALLAAGLLKAGVARCGIEATGGYERGVVQALRAVGLEVVVLQPRQVKAFAEYRLRRAKSDPLDARLIAQCVHHMGVADRMVPDARFEALGDMLTAIEQWEEDIARFKTRLEHISDRRIRKVIESDIKRLEKRREAGLKQLEAGLRRHDDLGRRFDLVQSVPGIGARTALSIVIRMTELACVSREQAASLAGLAPYVHKSGKFAGETHIGGGRARLRRALYAAAVPGAFRWNPALMALYQRMTKAGKSGKSALVACARKLLVFAVSVVQRGTPWEVGRPIRA